MRTVAWVLLVMLLEAAFMEPMLGNDQVAHERERAASWALAYAEAESMTQSKSTAHRISQLNVV